MAYRRLGPGDRVVYAGLGPPWRGVVRRVATEAADGERAYARVQYDNGVWLWESPSELAPEPEQQNPGD